MGAVDTVLSNPSAIVARDRMDVMRCDLMFLNYLGMNKISFGCAAELGGDHYRSEFQHWDLIEQNGIGYLEGCASKYVTRWRKKNGVQDLEKALHYVEKLQELHNPPCSSLFKPRCARGMATTAEGRRFTAGSVLAGRSAVDPARKSADVPGTGSAGQARPVVPRGSSSV